MQVDALRIVSAVAHELRSPLTSVRGYTSLLLKQWDTFEEDDRKQMVAQVDKDARRIQRLIAELLDISRIEQGRVTLNLSAVELDSTVASVVTTVAMGYPELDIEVDIPNSLPKLWADPDRVTQVLTNLIENACKYASPKGNRLEASATEEMVSVRVIDQGPGISASEATKIFDQFHMSHTSQPSGVGLGLWISRALMEAQGGTLDVTSDGKTGSTFEFSLPVSENR